MKNGLSKVTHLSLVKFPYACKTGDGTNQTHYHAGNKGKNSHSKHPYMRAGFVFKCCNKINQSYDHDHK